MQIQGKMLMKALSGVLFPDVCAGCSGKLDDLEEYICGTCYENLRYLTQEVVNIEFESHYRSFGIIDSIYPLFGLEKNSPELNIVHAIKYQNKRFLARYLGELIAGAYPALSEYDVISPIPLHKLKLLERGYNQTEFISKGISNMTSLPVTPVLRKIKYTESQTHKSASERRQNIYASFRINDKIEVTGKKILLVDDVLTTGATVSECGRILKAAGAAKVSVASAALTL